MFANKQLQKLLPKFSPNLLKYKQFTCFFIAWESGSVTMLFTTIFLGARRLVLFTLTPSEPEYDIFVPRILA